MVTTSECVGCNLREFLVHWMLNDGFSWGFPVAIFFWFIQTIPPNQAHESEEERKDLARGLKASLRSRKDAVFYSAMHFALLVMELVKGYWLLTSWWHSIYAWWTWELRKCQWMLQFDQFVMLVLLGLALPVLVAVGLWLVAITLVWAVELWQWEPKVSEDETWQLVQREEKDREN